VDHRIFAEEFDCWKPLLKFRKRRTKIEEQQQNTDEEDSIRVSDFRAKIKRSVGGGDFFGRRCGVLCQ